MAEINYGHEFLNTDEQRGIDEDFRPGQDILPVIEGCADVVGAHGWEFVAVVVPQARPGYPYAFRRQVQVA